MRFFSVFDKLQPYMRAIDWIVAVGSLGYGLWRQNMWWIAAGVILLGLAWLDPGTRLKRYTSFIKPPQAPMPVPPPVAAPIVTRKKKKRRP